MSQAAFTCFSPSLFVSQDKDRGGIRQEPLQAFSEPAGSAGGRVSAANVSLRDENALN